MKRKREDPREAVIIIELRSTLPTVCGALSGHVGSDSREDALSQDRKSGRTGVRARGVGAR